MGNHLCTCVSRPNRRSEDSNIIQNGKTAILESSNLTSPYDNEPMNSLKMEDSFVLEPSDIASDVTIETPIIPHKYIKENQHQNGNTLPAVCFRSNINTHNDQRRNTSVFNTEEPTESKDYRDMINAEIYDIILRDLLLNYYPINNDIINEMIKRNLLLPEDGRILLSRTSNADKCQTFLNNFVFSEINICKLATFLNVLLTSKSPILAELKRPDDFFQSIVDHIYYVVNFLSLLLQVSKEQKQMNGKNYFSNLISIVCIKDFKRLSSIPVKPFYAKVYMTNATVPKSFYKNFSCINQHFRCCQELTLSSSDLHSDDIMNLCLGFADSGVLKDLDISSNPITDEGLKHVSNLMGLKSSLRSLNIACCSLTRIGVEEFLETVVGIVPRCPLKKLNISHNNLCDMTEKYVLLLTKLSLVSLEIKNVELRHQNVLFESLKQNYSLKEVDFSGNKLQPNDITYLAAGLAYNSSVERISLVKIGLLRSDCSTMNNTFLMNKSITSIDLSDNLIGDDGAELLKDILTMKPTLRELFLKRCGISLHGALVLMRKASEVECNLKLLDLCYNHSPRMSIVVDIKDNIRKIQDLMHHITLVKEMRILLWGTLDEPIHIHSDCIEF